MIFLGKPACGRYRSGEVTKLRLVSWYLPTPLYKALQEIQEGTVIPATQTPRFGSVEALATQLLIVAVRETLRELEKTQP